MHVLLDIKDAKAPYLLEVLKGLSFVKTTQLTPVNNLFLKELSEAVDDVNKIKAGKLKAKSMKSFLNEL